MPFVIVYDSGSEARQAESRKYFDPISHRRTTRANNGMPSMLHSHIGVCRLAYCVHCTRQPCALDIGGADSSALAVTQRKANPQLSLSRLTARRLKWSHCCYEKQAAPGSAFLRFTSPSCTSITLQTKANMIASMLRPLSRLEKPYRLACILPRVSSVRGFAMASLIPWKLRFKS